MNNNLRVLIVIASIILGIFLSVSRTLGFQQFGAFIIGMVFMYLLLDGLEDKNQIKLKGGKIK
jgi:hypothetical protein